MAKRHITQELGMNEFPEDFIGILVSALSVAFVSLSGVIVKLYSDNQKLHEHNAQRDAADILAATKLADMLQRLREQSQQSHEAAKLAVEKLSQLENEFFQISQKIKDG